MSYESLVCLTLLDKWCLTKINSVLLSYKTGVLLELNPHILSQQLEKGQIRLDYGPDFRMSVPA
jgi:hypothetical protein